MCEKYNATHENNMYGPYEMGRESKGDSSWINLLDDILLLLPNIHCIHIKSSATFKSLSAT